MKKDDIIAIFEDNENSPLSKCIEILKNDNNSEFTKSNTNIVDKIREVVNDTSIEYNIFVDVVPDNKATIKIYEEALFEAYASGCTAYVIPYPCIEFAALQYLIKNYDVDSLQLKGDKKSLLLFNNILNGVDKSGKYLGTKIYTFETFCKYVLGGRKMHCMHNTNAPGFGMFWYNNCDCNHEYMNCEPISSESKSFGLLSELPVFPVTASIIRRKAKVRITAYEMMDYCIKLYKILCAFTNKSIRLFDYHTSDWIKIDNTGNAIR